MNQMNQKSLDLIISKKQHNLLESITSQNNTDIGVLGSTQSGKTYIITFGTLLYAQELYKYAPNEKFNAAIIGWTPDTLKRNIVEPMELFLTGMGLKKKEGKKKGDYVLKFGGETKYLKLYNLTIYFFGFNNYLSFNKILGGPLIFIWIDEAARIYTQQTLRESFNQLPGRQMSYAGHPYLKTIHSFNVEGGENHPYKKDFWDSNKGKKYIFYPYDNPKLDTEEKIKAVLEMFPPGTLRDQKVFNKWVISEGKVFNKLNVINELKHLLIREIGLGIDYGSANPTTFVPIALAFHTKLNKWILVRLECYYHDPVENGTNPTTEYFSKQLRLFLAYLKKKYQHIPITNLVIDSEATHFINRLIADNIPHDPADKYPGSVTEGVNHLQSLFYAEYFYILEHNSIKNIRNNRTIEYSGKDDSKVEFESYQYDTITSIKTGVDCFKKELDHSIDATRYIIQEFKETGRCPVV